jgi:hypothetical protein
MTHLQETLRQFTLENRRKRQLYRNPTALSRHLTFALAVLCLKNTRIATENSRSIVHKLWRTSIRCGKRRKSGRKCEPQIFTDQPGFKVGTRGQSYLERKAEPALNDTGLTTSENGQSTSVVNAKIS